MQKAGQQLSDDLDVPSAPTGVPKDVEAHVKLMFDLQVLAWQAEITRVSTMLMAKELSNAVYPKSGIRDAFHILSHHSNIQENIDRFTVLNRYHVTLFTYFLEKLRSTRTARGRCWITRWCCTAAPSATGTSTITPTCRSFSRAAHRAA